MTDKSAAENLLDAAKNKLDEAGDRLRAAGHDVAAKVSNNPLDAAAEKAKATVDRVKAEVHNTQAHANYNEGKNVINPSSVILSGEMMLRYMGWTEAADLTLKGLDGAIQSKHVTYDFARGMEGATEVKTSEFADKIIELM